MGSAAVLPSASKFARIHARIQLISWEDDSSLPHEKQLKSYRSSITRFVVVIFPIGAMSKSRLEGGGAKFDMEWNGLESFGNGIIYRQVSH